MLPKIDMYVVVAGERCVPSVPWLLRKCPFSCKDPTKHIVSTAALERDLSSLVLGLVASLSRLFNYSELQLPHLNRFKSRLSKPVPCAVLSVVSDWIVCF